MSPPTPEAMAWMPEANLVSQALDELDTFKAHAMATFGLPDAVPPPMPASDECKRRTTLNRHLPHLIRVEAPAFMGERN